MSLLEGPAVVVSNDISKGKAKYPIRVINSIDKPPIFQSFEYRSEPVFTDFLQKELPLRQFCQCLDQCSAANGCLCINMSTIKLSKPGRVENVDKLNGNPFNFSFYECTDGCGCAGKCGNYLGGKQQKHKLEIFRKNCAGYSCKTLKQIRKGIFICYMAGEVVSSNNKISENVSFTFQDETRQFAFTIKMDRFANESRFFNSSCCPNLMPITVYRKWITPERPFIAFLAINEINVGDELCFYYGDYWIYRKLLQNQKFVCYCNSHFCVWPPRREEIKETEKFSKKVKEQITDKNEELNKTRHLEKKKKNLELINNREEEEMEND
ncbi:hypothetical protein ACQ4LE_003755 [Meloidogyne hapla]|uniref:SET domain-containing protein n=1 Tax=Meloidogyne hapla TaxID=6305 RepID=A0A1I8C209_MELHA